MSIDYIIAVLCCHATITHTDADISTTSAGGTASPSNIAYTTSSEKGWPKHGFELCEIFCIEFAVKLATWHQGVNFS